MRPPFQLPQSVSGFHDYFKLNAETEDVLSALGFSFDVARLSLPAAGQAPPWAAELRQRLEESLPFVRLGSEMARREFLIAPVLLEVARHLHVQLRAEYAVNIDERLHGTLDYLLFSESDLVVVEAKNADLTRDTTQLCVELIALDSWTDSTAPMLYGAVSLGNIWQFAALDRQARRVVQDLTLYTVPDELDSLLRVLVGILKPGTPAENTPLP